MLAKRTSNNQVTLPKAIVQRLGEADYYDVTVQDGKIVLTPVRLQQADAVRAKLEALGITQDDVDEDGGGGPDAGGPAVAPVVRMSSTSRTRFPDRFTPGQSR